MLFGEKGITGFWSVLSRINGWAFGSDFIVNLLKLESTDTIKSEPNAHKVELERLLQNPLKNNFNQTYKLQNKIFKWVPLPWIPSLVIL